MKMVKKLNNVGHFDNSSDLYLKSLRRRVIFSNKQIGCIENVKMLRKLDNVGNFDNSSDLYLK